MSMYYTGSELFGLLIKEEEIDFFKEKYILLHPEEFKEYNDLSDKEEVMDEWLCCNESFKSSNGNGDFQIINIDGGISGNCDGTDFYSIFTPEKKPAEYYNIKDTRFENIYFIPASVSCDPIQIFRGQFYRNPEEVVLEMKGKTESYLPEDFPYHERIGVISYACFA